MSKVGEIKTKIQAALAPLLAKLGIKKSDAADSSASRPSTPPKIIQVYREGSTGTRLLLWILLLLFSVSVYSAVNAIYLLKKRAGSISAAMKRGTEKYDKMENFLKEQAETKHDIASTVSLDKIRVNSVSPDGRKGFISVTIWVKCDSPKTAKYVENAYAKFHDAIVTKIQEIPESEVTTEPGKQKLQRQMLEAMNSVLSEGKIHEIYFYNLIFDHP